MILGDVRSMRLVEPDLLPNGGSQDVLPTEACLEEAESGFRADHVEPVIGLHFGREKLFVVRPKNERKRTALRNVLVVVEHHLKASVEIEELRLIDARDCASRAPGLAF